MSKKLTKTSKGVAHHSPGRTRLKVPKSQRHKMHQIREKLMNTPGVKSVEMNHQTGSLLVHHEHDLEIFEVLHKTVETVGTDLLTTLIEGETAELLGPVSIVAAGVGLIASLGKSFLGAPQTEGNGGSSGNGGNSFPALLSGQATDLKTLIPAAFLAAAAYKAWETKTFWHGLTPMALTYWAFDTYWRFNVSNPAVFEPKNGQVKDEPRHG